MILKSLSLKKYKQYNDLELEFRDGLVGIVGRNGAGKSSIFEAVLVCLYGYMQSKDFIRSSWAKDKDAVVLELLFEIDNRTYKVRREFRGKALAHQAGLYDYQDQMIATGAKPVNDEVIKLVGMDKDAFTRSIFSGQKELGELSNTKGEERRRMVRKMVGLEKLDAIQSIVRKDKNSIREQIKGQTNLLMSEEDLNTKKETLSNLEKEKKEALKQTTQLEKALDKNAKTYQKAKLHFEQQSELYKNFNTLNTELIRFQNAVDNFESQSKVRKEEKLQLENLQKELKKQAPQFKQFENQKVQLKQLEKDKAQFDQVKSLQKDQQHYQEQLQAITTEFQALQKETKSIDKLSKQLVDIKSELTKIYENEENLQKKRSELEANRGAIQGKINERNDNIKAIEDLGKEAECPTCFRPLLDSYENILGSLKTQIAAYEAKDLKELNLQLKKITSEYNSTKEKETQQENNRQKIAGDLKVLATKKERLSTLTEQGKACKENLAKIEKQIAQIGIINFDIKAYEDLRDAIADMEKSYINYQKQIGETEKIPELTSKITELEERIKNGGVKIKEQEKKIQQLQFSESTHLKAKTDQEQAEILRDESLQLLNQQKEASNQIDRQILNVKNQLKSHDDTLKIIDDNNKELVQLETLDNIFKEFKTTILDKVKPTISYNASKLFQQITKGRYEGIKVDDNFEFNIVEDGTYYPITRFSGGEIDLANLCLRIGISRAIAELSGNDSGMSFLGFDEIFGSQDEERRFEILLALDLLKEQYRQIYIISHIDAVKESFPSILEVRKSTAGSTVNWL